MKIRNWIGLIAGLYFVLASVAAFAAPSSAGEGGPGVGDQGVGTGGGVPPTFLSGDVPPFAFLSDGKQAGFAVEILHEIMRRLGRADRIEFGEWQAVYQRSPLQGPDALKFGRVDLWLCSNITMERTAQAASVDPDLFKPLFVVEEVPSCLAFSKSVPEDVVNQWQGALDGLKKDGSWERIVSGWIPSELLKVGEPAVELSEFVGGFSS